MLFDQTKNIVKKIIGVNSTPQVNEHDVRVARRYIDVYWDKLKRYHPKDDETLIGLPNQYLVPAYEEGHPFDFNEMYYWDSYFMVQGMLTQKDQDLVLGILDNLVHVQKRYKIIPNASRTYLMGRSQPPLLTSFIFDAYDTYSLNHRWLEKHIASASQEYSRVWMGESKPNWRNVYMGLSRYYDINMTHDLAEAESGWDYTPRFNRKALNFLPVDLNAMLYKYETDFARAAKILGNEHDSKIWLKRAQVRKKTMDELMWSNAKGFYYDYNFVKKKRGSVTSLAGFFPMWAGMVDDKRAKKMVKALRQFENKGGLATTDPQPFNQITVPNQFPTQWAHPNGWAPLHFIVIKGLERYGYHEDAKRIALKWIKTNLDWFTKHGVFLEKYNVVNPGKPPVKGVYPSQTGFGWTNAVFEWLCQEYIDK